MRVQPCRYAQTDLIILSSLQFTLLALFTVIYRDAQSGSTVPPVSFFFNFPLDERDEGQVLGLAPHSPLCHPSNVPVRG